MKKRMFPIVLILSLMLVVGCTIAQDPDPGGGPQPGNDAGNGMDEPNGDTNDENDSNGEDENNEALTVADLFPMEPDIHLRYRGEEMEYASFETYIEFLKENVIQIRTINTGTTVADVYIIEEGSVIKVFTEGEIYHRYDYTDKRETQEIILMEPIEEGTSWTLEDGSERSITAVNMEIAVPAGTYHAVEITTVMEHSIIRNYYAKGIGLVKTEFVSKGSEDYPIISALESIEEDTAFEQTARIFFPYFHNERVVFVTAEFTLNTNDDILGLLEEELKSVPQDSDLTPPLTENTQLRSVKLDLAESLLTVDLSQHFLDELNAGSALESMILRSLVNTFGEYFGVNRVVLTLDGSLYSSGHFELQEGDYFTVDVEDIEEY